MEIGRKENFRGIPLNKEKKAMFFKEKTHSNTYGENYQLKYNLYT